MGPGYQRRALRVAVGAAMLLGLGAIRVRADKPHPARTHEYRREVESLEEQWRLAQLTEDTAAMDRLLSDDYVGISVNGRVSTKAQQIDRMARRQLVMTRIDLGEMKVKVVGRIAIVTAQAEVEGTNDGQPLHGMYRYTRIYQRLPGGEWKITSFEATKMSARQEAKMQAPDKGTD